MLAFAVVNEGFGRDLAGRSNTALNLMMFGGSFVAQWGIGVVAETARRGFALDEAGGLRVAFGLVLAGNIVTSPGSRAAGAGMRRRRVRSMHLHILGICGTFMGGLAAIAKRAGHVVTGCDANVYPPMSTQLAALGIGLTEGWDPAQLAGAAKGADVFVVGNVVSRGNPLMEAILNGGLPYISGPQWLYENVLHDKWVLAVAGTHGKTSTSAMLAWILEHAGLARDF